MRRLEPDRFAVQRQYIDGTVPSLYGFHSITLKPIYDSTFSSL